MVVKLLLVIATCLLLSAVRAGAIRPLTVDFAVPMYINSDRKLDVWTGVMAAQNEANAQDLLMGTMMNASFYFLPFFPTPAGLRTMLDNSFGVLRSEIYYTDALAAVTATINKPIIAPDAITTSLFTNTSRRFIHFSASFYEGYQIFNFAVHSSTLCQKILIFYINAPGVTEIVASVTNLAEAIGISCQIVSLGFQLVSVNTTIVLQGYFGSPLPLPRCVVILAQSQIFNQIIEALWGDSRFDRENVHFFGGSISYQSHFNTSFHGRAPFENVFLSQNFNNPQDPSIPSVAAYQKAVDSLLASNTTVPSQVAVGGIDAVRKVVSYNLVSYDAYMITRLTLEVLRYMPSLNPAAFIDRVYRSKYFSVDETVIGPYTDHCGGVTQPLPCYCNVGSHTLFMSRINTTTGVVQTIYDNAFLGEIGVAYSVADPSSCSFDGAKLAAPLHVTIVVNLENLGLYQQAYREAFIAGAVAGFVYVNQANTVLLGKFRLLTRYATTATANTVLTYLRENYLPYVLFAGDVVARDSTILGSFFTTPENLLLRDPPISAYFSRGDLWMNPTIADYIHATAAFIASLPLGSRVVVVAESTEQADLAIKSCNTFLVIPSLISTNCSRESIHEYFSIAQASPLVILLVSMTPIFTTNVLSWLSLEAGAATGSKLQHMTVALAADESHLWNYAQNANLSPLLSLRLVFASSLTEWWSPKSVLSQVISVAFPNQHVSPSTVRGFAAATVVASAASGAISNRSSAELVNAVYRVGVVTTPFLSVGPFYDASCTAEVIEANSPDRACQCQKGPHQFFVHEFRDYVNKTSPAVVFQYINPWCGVLYIPLPTVPNDSILSTTAVVIISVSAATLAMILYFGNKLRQTAHFDTIIKSGLLVMCVSLTVQVANVTLAVFSSLFVVAKSKSLVFICFYVVLTGLCAVASLGEIFLRVKWFSVQVEAGGEVPDDVVLWWDVVLAEASVMTLCVQDIPMLMLGFAAIMELPLNITVLLSLVLSSFLCGLKARGVHSVLAQQLEKFERLRYTRQFRTLRSLVNFVICLRRITGNFVFKDLPTRHSSVEEVEEYQAQYKTTCPERFSELCGLATAFSVTLKKSHVLAGEYFGVVAPNLADRFEGVTACTSSVTRKKTSYRWFGAQSTSFEVQSPKPPEALDEVQEADEDDDMLRMNATIERIFGVNVD